MKSLINKALSTPLRVWLFILLAYSGASFFSASIREADPQPGDHTVYYRKNFWVGLTVPRILRGDEMHYLIMAHSLAEDGDLYLSDEYTRVHLGGPEMGVYHAQRPADNMFQHFSRDRNLTLLANHPFGLSALMAMLLWPLAGSAAMESAAILVTAFWGAMGALVFLRVLEALGVGWKQARAATLLMAFATPWFSYSRTLYTEVYIGTAMLIVTLAVLKNRTLWTLPFLVMMGWFKYPALTLFFGAGTGEALFRRWRNFFIFGLMGAAVLAGVFAFNRHFFAESGWVTRDVTEAARRPGRLATAAAPIAWVPGELANNVKRLFLDGDKGLFPHCPLMFVAVAGLVVLARRQRRAFWLIMAVAGPWFLVHISYNYLMAGASYTTRYLVPVVPMAMLALPWFWNWAENRRGWMWAGYVLAVVSLVNNIIAGVLPGLTFDRKPWEIWGELVRVLRALVG